MFGSDWPVCCVGARAAEDGESDGGGGGGEGEGEGGSNANAWREWYRIVVRLLDELGFSEEEREWVWWRTSVEVYGLDRVGG